MSKLDDLKKWAQLYNYTFNADTEVFEANGALDLDSFRNWSSANNHIVGQFRNQRFEMLDVKKHKRGRNSRFFTQTMLILPEAATEIPDFEIMPSRSQKHTKLFGIDGLKLTTDNAHDSIKNEIKEFSKHYTLYAGGLYESVTEHLSQPEKTNLEDLDEICKMNVFRFLTQNPGWHIESQGEHLVLYSDSKILSPEERTTLLRTATELKNVLHHAKYEGVVPGIKPQCNITISKEKMFSIFGGAALGFFLSIFIALAFFKLINFPMGVYTIPIWVHFGATGGIHLGKKVGTFLERKPSLSS